MQKENQTYQISGQEVGEMLEMANKVSVSIVRAVAQKELGAVEAAATAWGLAKATTFLLEVMRHKGFDASQVYQEGMEVLGEYTRTEDFCKLLEEMDEKKKDLKKKGGLKKKGDLNKEKDLKMKEDLKKKGGQP